MFIALLLTPYLIRTLGTEAFGVWALALSFSFLGGYASMVDIGIETAAARYVAEARADGNHAAVSEIASTTLAFFGLVAVVAAPILVALAFVLPDLFDVPSDLHDGAVVCFALVGAQLLFELPARVFFAVLEGAQRYALYQVLELVRSLAQAVFFVVAIETGLGVGGLGAAVMASSLLVLVISWGLARRTIPDVRLRVRSVSRGRFKELASFGGQYFFVRVMGTLYRQIDKAIVGVALGVKQVTFYEVANRIHQAASMVQSVAASSLLPATAYLRRETALLRDFFLRGTCYAVAISLPAVGAGLIFAEPLIRTWISESLVGAADSARIFLAFLAIVSVHAIGAAMIIALDHMRFVIGVTLVFTLVNVLVSIALVGPLEVNGVILGSLIAQAVIWLPYTRHFLRTFDVPVGEWLRRVIVPNLPGSAMQALTAAPLLYLANRTGSLPVVFLLAFVSAALSIAAFIAVGVRGRDRELLFVALRGALGMQPQTSSAGQREAEGQDGTSPSSQSSL